MKHTIQALVENKFGVLARVASLFSARGYNISSLAVGETQDRTVSCMTIVVNAKDEIILEQIKKQLHKLVDTITVLDLTGKDYIDRELLLVKVSHNSKGDKKIKRLKAKYSFDILEKKKSYLVIQFAGNHNQIENILKDLNSISIKELVRTGKIAIIK